MDSRIFSVIDLFLSKSVDIVFIHDNSIGRVVGALTMTRVLEILASGVNPHRISVSKHMIPGDKHQNGILRVKPETPISELRNFVQTFNPICIIVESSESPQAKTTKRSSKKKSNSMIGYISPDDYDLAIEELDTLTAETNSIEHRSEAILRNAKSIKKATIATPPQFLSAIEGNSSRISLVNDREIDKEIASQLVEIAAFHCGMEILSESSGILLRQPQSVHCALSIGPGNLRSVWPMSDQDAILFAQKSPVICVSWLDSNSLSVPQDWYDDIGALKALTRIEPQVHLIQCRKIATGRLVPYNITRLDGPIPDGAGYDSFIPKDDGLLAASRVLICAISSIPTNKAGGRGKSVISKISG